MPNRDIESQPKGRIVQARAARFLPWRQGHLSMKLASDITQVTPYSDSANSKTEPVTHPASQGGLCSKPGFGSMTYKASDPRQGVVTFLSCKSPHLKKMPED